MKPSRLPLAPWTVGFTSTMVILAMLPVFVPRYFLSIGIEVFVMSLFSLSFNLMFGYAGLLSFGQAAFFGVGAYACALILKHVYGSIFLSLFGSVVVSGALAFVIGFVCVRFTRMYFIMLTVAFGELMYAIGNKWVSLTGGDDGLVGIPIPSLKIWFLPAFDLLDIPTYYYFTLICVGIAVSIIRIIVNSHYGYVLRALHENPERVEFLGLNVRRHLLLCFTIAGLFTGLAGALTVPFEGMVSPAELHFTKSADPVLMTILGGTRFFCGPLVGAAMFLITKDIIQNFTEFWMFWMGTILVLIVIFSPGGVVGFLHSVSSYFSREVPKDIPGSTK
jgi:branched-chain amino acid transport system permease protein